MARNIAVSIIVPIYNVAVFLGRCLDSIAAQTFKNFNVYIIDDGSDDGSGAIAEKYVRKDSRFFYKKIERGGVAQARNVGLSLSDGEYIAFVDGDDFVAPDYIEKLYRAAADNDCKISSCNYNIHNEDAPQKSHCVKIRKLKTGIYTRDFYLNRVIRDWSVRSYLWNKLWHRSLFDDNGITFPKMYFEDIATVARLVFHTNKVAVIDEPLYNYSVHENSIMTTAKVEKINDYILSFGILKNYIQYRGEYKKFRLAFFRLAYIIFFANYYNIFKMHAICHNFKGWIKNQHIANKCIYNFAGKGFVASDKNPELECYIFAPENKKK